MNRGKQCEITECPQNRYNSIDTVFVCELSKLDDKHPNHVDPKRCNHRLFKLKSQEDK